jgi:DNA-binding transcriptional ArsR family regulator
MTDDIFQKKAELLNIMANAQRLKMLTMLSEGPLARYLGLSQSALSQHLAKLRAADIVITRRDAQTVYYSLKSDKVVPVLTMLDQLFTKPARLDRIAS